MCHSIRNIFIKIIGFISKKACIMFYIFSYLFFSQFISAETPPKDMPTPSLANSGGPKGNQGSSAQNKFSVPSTTNKNDSLTTLIHRLTFNESCYYLAYYCLKAYVTGPVCGRTLFYTYYTFKNYCMLDYSNCMDRYEVWQIAYMGKCFNITELTEYLLYPYDNDDFLDEYYMVEDH